MMWQQAARRFKDLGNPDVFEAGDGREALRLIANGVDFVISDFNMPELNGLNFLRRSVPASTALRERPRLPCSRGIQTRA